MNFFETRTLEIVRYHTTSNPIIGKSLAEAINLPTRKSGKEGSDIRYIVNQLRQAGYPICASENGYFMARDKKELSDFISSSERRIASQQAAVDGLKKSFAYLKNPQKFEQKVEEAEMEKFSQQVLT